MATIGTFRISIDEYEGHIETRLWHTTATIKATKKTSDKGPDYRIMAGRYEIGAAWRKMSEAGVSYLSVSLDDPSFPAPINCRLLQVNQASDSESVPYTHELVWTRS